jgi:excisionase family DNA binding protein
MSDNGSHPAGRRLELTRRLLTASQVAEVLGIPVSSVYDYARRAVNPLPSLAIGRHRRFYQADVERWLDDQRTA